MVGVLETLKAAARDRWGEKWTIRQDHYADGTSRAYAFRVRGSTEEGYGIQGRLFVGADGQVYHDRVTLDYEQVVDVLEEDNAPEEIRGEIIDDSEN